MKSLKPQWKNRWHEKSLESVHQILLASRSPRRKELLRYILPNFLTDAASLDEDSFFEKQMGANRHLKYIERVERATAFLAKEK